MALAVRMSAYDGDIRHAAEVRGYAACWPRKSATHDALGDVKATIFMARLVKQRAPAIWNALMPMAAK